MAKVAVTKARLDALAAAVAKATCSPSPMTIAEMASAVEGARCVRVEGRVAADYEERKAPLALCSVPVLGEHASDDTLCVDVAIDADEEGPLQQVRTRAYNAAGRDLTVGNYDDSVKVRQYIARRDASSRKTSRTEYARADSTESGIGTLNVASDGTVSMWVDSSSGYKVPKGSFVLVASW